MALGISQKPKSFKIFAKKFKSRFCQATVADRMKNGSPYFDIFADNIAVINTSMV